MRLHVLQPGTSSLVCNATMQEQIIWPPAACRPASCHPLIRAIGQRRVTPTELSLVATESTISVHHPPTMECSGRPLVLGQKLGRQSRTRKTACSRSPRPGRAVTSNCAVKCWQRSGQVRLLAKMADETWRVGVGRNEEPSGRACKRQMEAGAETKVLTMSQEYAVNFAAKLEEHIDWDWDQGRMSCMVRKPRRQSMAAILRSQVPQTLLVLS